MGLKARREDSFGYFSLTILNVNVTIANPCLFFSVLGITKKICLCFFPQDLLPGLLGYCHSCLQSPDGSSDVEVLGILTKLIQYRLPADTGVMRPHDLKRYTLEFTNIIRR